MGDGGNGVCNVLVQSGGDGDGLRQMPVRRGEGQGTGDGGDGLGDALTPALSQRERGCLRGRGGHWGRYWGDRRRDGDLAGGGGVQYDPVDAGATFGEGEGSRDKEYARTTGHGNDRTEPSVEASFVVSTLGYRKHDGRQHNDRRRRRDRAKYFAGATPGRNGDGTRVYTSSPGQGHRQGGRMRKPRPNPTITLLLKLDREPEGGTRVASKEQQEKGIQPGEEVVG